MDDTHLAAITNQKQLTAVWQANLVLDFANEAGRSYLARRQHSGPLVVQKTLHPEGTGVCHGIIVHPPGGVAGGDRLTLQANLQAEAHALLTTPGAGKWYKANGHEASQAVIFKLAGQACLEWLPQENILFDGAQVNFSARINLAAGASYAGWDIICFGRQAQQERWQSGHLHQNLAIYRQQKLIWREVTKLTPDSRGMTSMVGLGANAVSASFVVVAGNVPADILQTCKAVQPNLALDLQARYGVTALPEVLSVRYVGQSAQTARQYFEQLWRILRPWYADRSAARPRIWNT